MLCIFTLDVAHVKLLVTSVASLQSKMARCVVAGVMVCLSFMNSERCVNLAPSVSVVL